MWRFTKLPVIVLVLQVPLHVFTVIVVSYCAVYRQALMVNTVLHAMCTLQSGLLHTHALIIARRAMFCHMQPTRTSTQQHAIGLHDVINQDTHCTDLC